MAGADSFYKQFFQKIKELYPSAPQDKELLKKSVSPHCVPLNLSFREKIQNTVKNVFLWSRLQSKNHKFIPSFPKVNHYSVLMAYDFHITPSGRLKLIEINTNASGFLLVDLIEKTKGIHSKALDVLKASFFNEWSLFHKGCLSGKTPKNSIILDENIDQQKMKFEFFMYQDLMRSWGWPAKVMDVKEVKISPKGRLMDSSGQQVDFVYNRLTDFYFERWKNILQAYQSCQTVFSPHPGEYALLADKKNLCRLSSFVFDYTRIEKEIDLHLLQEVVLKTDFLKSKESAWENKKNLFFKPLQGYGGKSAYKGASLSKKKLLALENCVIQEYAPPMKYKTTPPPQEWKIDIRAYAYQDQVQLIGARLYKGQLTNFKTPGGGFCRVKFS